MSAPTIELRDVIAHVGGLCQVLADYRPDIYRDVRDMAPTDAIREAGRRLGVDVPENAPFEICDDLTAVAKKGAA